MFSRILLIILLLASTHAQTAMNIRNWFTVRDFSQDEYNETLLLFTNEINNIKTWNQGVNEDLVNHINATHRSYALYGEALTLLSNTEWQLYANTPNSRKENAYVSFITQVLLSKIMRTSLGKQFCQIGQYNKDFFTAVTGINNNFADMLINKCKVKDDSQKIQMDKYIGMVEPRQFIFIVTGKTLDRNRENLTLKMDSWTNDKNTTYIFIPQKKYTPQELEKELLIRILHELVISIDSKESLGFLGVVNNNTLEKYQLQLPPEDQVKDDLDMSTNTACRISSVYRNSDVKYAFSVLRALRHESKVLGELQIDNTGITNFLQKSCEDKALHMAKLMTPFRIFLGLKAEYLKISIESKCADQASLSHEEIIKALAQGRLVSKDQSQTSINLCEFLSTPSVGLSIGGPIQGGPRPRGGGF